MKLQRRRPNLLLRQARLRRGWSLQRVADLLNQLEGGPFGVDRVMVYRWEQGVKTPSPFYRERLCHIFGMPADQLGLVELDEQASREASEFHGGTVPAIRWWGDTSVLGHLHAADPITTRILTDTRSTDLERRAALQWFLAVAGSVVVGPPLDLLGESPSESAKLATAQPQSLDIVTQAYRQQFQAVPSYQLTRPVVGHFQFVSEQVQQATSLELRAQLLSSLGQVAQLAGRVSFDRNDYPAARAYHKIAIQAGQAGASHEVTAYAIGCLASISSDCGYPKEALNLLTGSACTEAASKTTATTRAWLAALEAEVGALLGNEPRALGSLDRAHRLLAGADVQEAPVWMRFFDQPRLAAYQGFCAMQLRRVDAEQVLRQAAATLAPIYTKRRSVVLADLAAHYAHAGEIHQAAEYVAGSYELALLTHSAIYAERAGAVRRWLERHDRRHPAVKALHERLQVMGVR